MSYLCKLSKRSFSRAFVLCVLIFFAVFIESEKIADNRIKITSVGKSTTLLSSVNIISKVAKPSTTLVFSSYGATREFIAEAKKNPQIGGYWVAEYAIELCAQFKFMLTNYPLPKLSEIQTSSNPSNSLRRTVAYHVVLNQCEGVSNSQTEIEALRKEGRQLGDPRIQAWDLRNKAMRSGNHTEAFEILTKHLDPLMLAVESTSLLYGKSEDAVNEFVFFDGRWLFGKEAKNLRLASYLLSCDFGFPCGTTRFEVALACAVQDRCFDSFEDLIFSKKNLDDEINPTQINIFKLQLKSKLLSGDVEAFIPRQKKGNG
ncbi:hypothetical protein [Undibacterium sp. Xuan67W]|uniref:hypothetical protein n=1 Tax=Undibacterium sp. Xuan67W TaxID=3413057 RepID=UPI003BF5C7FD